MGSENIGHNGFFRRVANVVLPPALWLVCRTLGVLTWAFTSRREIALRNISLAFPEKDERWHKRMAFKSVLRMFELFAAPMVIPWISDDEIRRRYKFTPRAIAYLDTIRDGKPAVMQAPHCASGEALSTVQLLYPQFQLTTVYRPLDLAAANKYIVWARCRFDMKLISRKSGLLAISHALAKHECVGILFDQNTLTSGALVLSFGRVCSATDLPGILSSRLQVPTCLVHPRRTGFLRSDFDIVPVETDGSAAEITAVTSHMLEKNLQNDEEACSDWMWAHNRWKSELCRINNCLSLAHKKDYLPVSLKIAGLTELPRRQPFILRVPKDRERAEILSKWMPRLRAARPDVRWIVVANKEASGFFREKENCERLVVSEDAGLPAALKSLRSEWAEFYLTMEPDADAGTESRQCGAQHALGISSAHTRGKRRVTIFKAEASDFAPDRFDNLLANVFKSCGYGMSAR
jgi:heptosyltransferase II